MDELRNGIPAKQFDGRLRPAAIGVGTTYTPPVMYDLQTTRLLWRKELCELHGEKMPIVLKKKLEKRLQEAKKNNTFFVNY